MEASLARIYGSAETCQDANLVGTQRSHTGPAHAICQDAHLADAGHANAQCQDAHLAGTQSSHTGPAHASQKRCVSLSTVHTAPGHAHDPNASGGGTDFPARKKWRQLEEQVSIDEKTTYLHQSQLKTRVVLAEDMKNKGLDMLAAEHLQSFKEALGVEHDRRLAPNREIRIATGCTGSGGEVFTVLAVLEALRPHYPGLRFKYVWHCEKHPTKRKFVQTLHEHLASRLGATDPPCFYDDITKIVSGEARCAEHSESQKKKKLPQLCPVKPFHWLFCSSSCKDLSKENSGRQKGNCFQHRKPTPGGSAETFWALTDIMTKFRPDVVYFENVEDIAKNNGDESNLEILKTQWKALGYECLVIHTDTKTHGLPQNRKRIVIVALNVRDPQLFTFTARDVDKAFNTLGALIRLCHRQTECATKYLLPWDNQHVTDYEERCHGEAEARHDQGFDLEKNMEFCESRGIPWGTFPVGRWPDLQASPWFETLSSRQKEALCFNLAEYPDKRIVFRNVAQTLGQGRTAGIGLDGKVAVGTVMPSQLTFAFVPGKLPRRILGRESFLLQGFPIDVLEAECFKRFQKTTKQEFCEGNFQDMAGNMVATPVMLATVMATMTAVSWIEDDPGAATGSEELPEAAEKADKAEKAEKADEEEPEELPEWLHEAEKAPEAEDGLMSGGPDPTTRRGCLLQRVLSMPPLDSTGPAHAAA